MDELTAKVECLKLATQICLATADKSASSVVEMSTVLYTSIKLQGETSSEPRTLSLNRGKK